MTQKKMGRPPTTFLLRAALLILLVDASVFGLSEYGNLMHAGMISGGLRILAMGLIATQYVLDARVNRSTFWGMALSCAVFLISFLRSHTSHMLYMTAAILIANRVGFERLIRFEVKIRTVILVFILSSSLLGLIPNYMPYRIGTEIERHSLGFTHPNTLGMQLFVAAAEWIYVLKEKQMIKRMTVALFFAIAIEGLSKSRTSLVCLAFYAGCLLIMEKRRKQRVRKSVLWLIRHAQTLACLFCIGAFMVITQSEWAMRMDALLSGRLNNAYRVYTQYGFTWMGQNVRLVATRMAKETGERMAILDIAPLRMMIQCGIVPMVLMLWAYQKALTKAAAEKDKPMLALLLTFCMFGMAESTFNNPMVNLCWFYAFRACFRPEDRKRRREQRVYFIFESRKRINQEKREDK